MQNREEIQALEIEMGELDAVEELTEDEAPFLAKAQWLLNWILS